MFSYSTLKVNAGQIRLVTLLPRKHEDARTALLLTSTNSTPQDAGIETMQCTMCVANLDDNPEYVALSYTWGSQIRSHTFTINEAYLHITESVEVALRHLQQEYEGLNLWIDQLCINQEDNHEKSEQVA